MIAVLQRVKEASVSIDGNKAAECRQGLLILLGVARGDGEEDARLLADKISKLRIFQDGAGKMNLSVNDVGGSVVVVPNFTLLASYRKGNRPDFFNSAPPEEAEPLFEFFSDYIATLVPGAGRGVFGADMKVSLINDGPVTITMDSNVLKGRNET